MNCHFCEKGEESLPFRCNYCGNYFCSDHRLPENHACPRVGGPKQPGYSNTPSILSRSSARAKGLRGQSGSSKRGPKFLFGVGASLFSRSEKRHVLLAAVMITVVGLSMEAPLLFPLDWAPVSLSIICFLIAFLGHELAHKLLAQRNGLWAEFRTNPYGLIFTAISVIFPFKFIAPGHVSIIGQANRELSGTIALAGPGFNLVFGTVMILSSVVLGQVLGVLNFAFAMQTAGKFNGYMALFNLIPFMGFDGYAAFDWDKLRWAMALAAAIAVTVAGFVIPL